MTEDWRPISELEILLDALEAEVMGATDDEIRGLLGLGELMFVVPEAPIQEKAPPAEDQPAEDHRGHSPH